jgi:hypothetical protein
LNGFFGHGRLLFLSKDDWGPGAARSSRGRRGEFPRGERAILSVKLEQDKKSPAEGNCQAGFHAPAGLFWPEEAGFGAMGEM